MSKKQNNEPIKGQASLFSFFKKSSEPPSSSAPSQRAIPSSSTTTVGSTAATNASSSSTTTKQLSTPLTASKKPASSPWTATTKKQAENGAAIAAETSSSLASSGTKNVNRTPLTERRLAPSSSSSSSSAAAASNVVPMINTPPLTSEADAVAPSSSSAPPSVKVPTKRSAIVESDDDEAEDEIVAFKKKFAAGKPKAKSTAVADSEDEQAFLDDDSSSEEEVRPRKKATKGKGKKDDDDDDFSASGGADSDSDDYFKDDIDMDDLDSDAFEPEPKGKGKSVASSSPSTSKKATPTPSRPPLKPSGASGSGGLSSIKTQAEVAREKAKQQKNANEATFSFLVDPKDVSMSQLSPLKRTYARADAEPGYDPRTLRIPSKAWNTFTPFERQFWEIKQNHYDTVLFFQKGKFFELYEEDAAIGHREFDLKLTDRVKMKMVGVPEASFDFWAAKFLAQGYKVGRVDQVETALGAEIRVKDGKANGKPTAKKTGNQKEIVRRELKSVLTSGTLVDGSLLTDDLSSHCVAIKEDTPTASSIPTFGVCVLDASTAQFDLSFFADDTGRTQLETLIRQLKPKEVIHEKGNLTVSTLRLLRSCLSIDTQWTALKAGTEFKRADDTRKSLVKLFKQAKDANSADDDIDVEATAEEDEAALVPESIRSMYDKPLAMSALGGMIWYLEQLNLDKELVTNNNFNIYDPLSQGRALVLDGQTLAHIEVLQNSQGGIEGTLLQLLSRCVTPFGKRLFKVWLCAPLREASAINQRLDAVEDLLAHANFVSTFDSMAKKLPDLERMLSRIHAKSCKKQDFLKVVASFGKVARTLEVLGNLADEFVSTGIPQLIRSAPDVGPLLEEIEAMYDGDDLLPVEGKDEQYEIVRLKVEEIEEKLDEQLEKAKKDLRRVQGKAHENPVQPLISLSGSSSGNSCPAIVYRDIGTKDIFQIQVPVKIKAPSNWTKMSSTKILTCLCRLSQDVNRYWSPEVTRLVTKLKEARERKQAVVNDFHLRVYAAFDRDYSTFLQVVKTVAELDCLLSLSKSSAALGEPAVRPEIIADSDRAVLEFEELRHPCILNASVDFIPNDVALGGDTEQLILLTGPNMAGKSTLLRMTCAAIIMAQLGCFVPAAKARIAPVDAIYSRMGANDFIFANASTFKVEMDDCNKILTKATPRSLVILDELGRGTSTYDGMAIAYSVLHRLATHVGCVGFFATHFTSLTEDFEYHPQIRLCNMSTQVSDDTRAVVFLYKLINGSAPKSYGPHVAAMAGMPDSLVQRAIDISRQFETTSRARERKMRANESLPLTLQADAAFLMKLAQLGLDSYEGDKSQLVRTFKTIKQGIELVHRKPRASAPLAPLPTAS
ncbi:BQ2448_5126 [Microbotryum intermedium]|uniref:DNA mismatch repair protein n=1 Tax=Microbotryum intermedium TaxID=269621 RepID=A0A238F3C8_9BASI|nr:BQ2448_5126 [Microbotryum intermedium]